MSSKDENVEVLRTIAGLLPNQGIHIASFERFYPSEPHTSLVETKSYANLERNGPVDLDDIDAVISLVCIM